MGATAKTPWGQFDNLMQAFFKIGMSDEVPHIPETLSSSCRGFMVRCLQRDPASRLSASELLNLRFARVGAGEDDDGLPDDADLLPRSDSLLPDTLLSQSVDATYGADDDIGRRPL